MLVNIQESATKACSVFQAKEELQLNQIGQNTGLISTDKSQQSIFLERWMCLKKQLKNYSKYNKLIKQNVD
jgi:hypothetical protein